MNPRARTLAALALLQSAAILGGAAAPVLAGHGHAFRSWGVAALEAPRAWQAGHEGEGVNVAVIEAHAFDVFHPVLAPRVGWCTDLSGAPGACHADDAETASHGTHVAGIVHQVAPRGTLYLLSLRGSGEDIFARLQAALELAAQGPDGEAGTADDARIATLSLQVSRAPVRDGMALAGVDDGDALPGVGARMAREHPLRVPPGLAVIAAAGNTAWGDLLATLTYPAAQPDLVAVGAVRGHGARSFTMWERSAKGLPSEARASPPIEVDFAAPGASIESTIPGGGWGVQSGTSMAAPHLAGLAALYFGARPQAATPDFVRDAACASIDLDMRGWHTDPGHDPASGWGVPLAPETMEGCR